MLRAIAAAYGARFAETLTGFKWIARAGAGLVYGYEEALGYCVDPDAVRDKDGIAAAVLAADLAATLKAAGGGLPDRLDELATAARRARHRGTAGPDGAGRARRRRRAAPGPAPRGLAHRPSRADVLAASEASERGADHAREPTIEREERVVIRPSGTEPKLKAYLQVVEPVSGDLPAARAAADARLHALRTEVEAMIGGPGSGGGDHRASLPPVPRPKVHDAALRARLLECAGATLSTRGLAALSLRTLAADVGTSTTAVYALFGGKPGCSPPCTPRRSPASGPGWTPCRSARTRWRTSSPSAAPTATPRSPTPTSTT